MTPGRLVDFHGFTHIVFSVEAPERQAASCGSNDNRYTANLSGSQRSPSSEGDAM